MVPAVITKATTLLTDNTSNTSGRAGVSTLLESIQEVVTSSSSRDASAHLSARISASGATLGDGRAGSNTSLDGGQAGQSCDERSGLDHFD
jgi:hypothetical protein